jgi:hypothetical protein
LAYPSSLLSHERPDISPRATVERGSGNSLDWASFELDLALVRRTKANLLLVGSECLVMNVIRGVIADVPASIIHAEAGRLLLPEAWPHPGTVVLCDVDTLDAGGQVRLSEWLEHGGADHQIISTSSTPLLPLIEAGAFDPTLYYRLNTVYIRLD